MPEQIANPAVVTTIHRGTAAAPPEFLFDVVAAVENWPQFFAAAVHAEYLEAGEGTDVVRRWFLTPDQGRVVVRTSRRHLDRSAMRITLEDVEPQAPRAASRVEWLFTKSADGSDVEVRHELTLSDGTTEETRAAVLADLERNAAAQLDAVLDQGNRRELLDQLVLSFEDPLFVAGRAEDAYEVLNEADKWPERIAHVSQLTMTEDEPGIQFFDMETSTPDGVPHSTRSVRVCLPPRLIVYKQIKLPPLLDAHTGHWRFTRTPEGIIVSARHTVTIKPSALGILGEGTTIQDARNYLRNVLSANSMKNLQLSKAFAEGRARA
ncbi:SRPBCC family protein [Kitasatospora sp. NPDC001540]|uniref:SRPBCC family protein n=1 Tax=Kitasatospora sp. NPDC001540 TaxID=3364014 RepID=UPI0036A6F0CF